MPHQDTLNEFRAAVAKYLGFIDNGYRQDTSGTALFDSTFQGFCVQAAFLGIYVAWETFLERSLIDYTLGVTAISGRQIPKYVTPIDGVHSNRILIGTQKYVDWSNPDIVTRLAGLYLANGEPFNTYLKSIQAVLFDLKTIRNACAHLSTSTSTQLDAVASRMLSRPISGISVTDFLTAIDPNGQPNDTILDGLLGYLDACAENISKA